MISFILNDKHIKQIKPAGITLLDFIRYESGLKGTKIGCREGDCGACTVIEGQLDNGFIKYKTIVSCLTPLGNVHGKHIVTIEGLNQKQLSPVQQALVDHNGTQCGFCTPGFAISLTAFLLNEGKSDLDTAIAAIDGNICRCTGYKSIERAAADLVEIKKKIPALEIVNWLVKNDFLPEYFSDINRQLENIQSLPGYKSASNIIVGGGTDLYVQIPDKLFVEDLTFASKSNFSDKISVSDSNVCTIKGFATATDIMESAVLQKYFPNLNKHFKLISSTPIRNMGTIAGNFVNASPIGDLSIFFLALDAELILSKAGRKVKLKDFFLDYKKIDLQENELIEAIVVPTPRKV